MATIPQPCLISKLPSSRYLKAKTSALKPSLLREKMMRQACNDSFENINDKDITKEMIRRMSQCLQMASWGKDGRFNSGPQRNQARFVKDAAEAFEGDNAHERDCF